MPPNLRVEELSACEKASKMTCCLELGIPMPESSIAKWNRAAFSEIDSVLTVRLTNPSLVNLIALQSRFRRTCRKRPGSPMSWSGKPSCEGHVKTQSFFARLN